MAYVYICTSCADSFEDLNHYTCKGDYDQLFCDKCLWSPDGLIDYEEISKRPLQDPYICEECNTYFYDKNHFEKTSRLDAEDLCENCLIEHMREISKMLRGK